MLSLPLFLMTTVAFSPQPDISVEVIEGKSSSNIVFFAPHENESLANDYLANKISQTMGRFVILKQNGKRTISLDIRLPNKEPSSVNIDPNRIFTPLGRAQNINKLNPQLSKQPKIFKAAKQKAAELSAFILQHLQLKKNSTLVATHNNTNGFDFDGKGGEGTVSIIRYQKKLDSGARFLSEVFQGKDDEDDLFYLTEQTDFEHYKKDGWNIVLQNPLVITDPSEDDGSLSVYAQKNKIRYINIETERKSEQGGRDHLEEKKKMIDYVLSKP
ncbi:MAG: hypothetical protein KUG78_16420 [Kangiellaceae bacterium]|nr:hypothetical protein [Kangiellaceae bacterium]